MVSITYNNDTRDTEIKNDEIDFDGFIKHMKAKFLTGKESQNYLFFYDGNCMKGIKDNEDLGTALRKQGEFFLTDTDAPSIQTQAPVVAPQDTQTKKRALEELDFKRNNRPRLNQISWENVGGTLMIDPEHFEYFPKCDEADFGKIRRDCQCAYFDRTDYIAKLESFHSDALLFLRPRRFGKSLTLSMLAYFHGVEHKNDYESLFKGLKIDNLIKQETERIAQMENKDLAIPYLPNQWLVLKIDFSITARGRNFDDLADYLNKLVNNSIKRYYKTYHSYLEYLNYEDLEQFIDQKSAIFSLQKCVRITRSVLEKAYLTTNIEHPLHKVKGIFLMADEYDAVRNEYIDPKDENSNYLSSEKSFLRGFWGSVKALGGGSDALSSGTFRSYITGVTSLSLADRTSGYNIQCNTSFTPTVAGLCGLSKEDVNAALDVIYRKHYPNDLSNEVVIKRQEDLDQMVKYFNGYYFCNYKHEDARPVFNTNTCLEYLQNLLNNISLPRYMIINPPNSEVSDQMLEVLAQSDTTINVLQSILNSELPRLDHGIDRWVCSFRYSCKDAPSTIAVELHMRNLRDDIEDVSTWLGLLVYVGGFTFDHTNPEEFLRIPNRVAAERFANTIMKRYAGPTEDIKKAFHQVASNGDILLLLKHCQALMCNIDVHPKHFALSEETHRNRFYHLLRIYLLVLNPTLEVSVQTHFKEYSQRIDLNIKTMSTSTLPKLIITEWKNLQIDYLNIPSVRGTSDMRIRKAATLSNMDVNGVLNLTFAAHDQFHPPGKTIETWIRGTTGFPTYDNKSPLSQLRNYINQLSNTQLMANVHAYLVIVVGSRKILLWEVYTNGPSEGSLKGSACLADW